MSDAKVWKRAHDYLGLMNEPAICLSVLGPSHGQMQNPGTVNWSEGGKKMIAHIPFYILGEQEGMRLLFSRKVIVFLKEFKFLKHEYHCLGSDRSVQKRFFYLKFQRGIKFVF